MEMEAFEKIATGDGRFSTNTRNYYSRMNKNNVCND